MPAYIFYDPLDNEEVMRLYKQGLTDEEIAYKFRVEREKISSWRWRRGLSANKPKQQEDDGYAADINKCRKCEYWRGTHSYNSPYKCCHFLLETGRRRERGEGKVCLSYTKRFSHG